jgi:hypothetical protein
MLEVQEQTKSQGKKRFPSPVFFGAALSLIGCWLILCVSITNLSIIDAGIKQLDDLSAIDKFDAENQPQANTPEYRDHFEEVQRRKKQADDKLQAATQAAYSRQNYLLIATAAVLFVGSLVIPLFRFKLGNRVYPPGAFG